MLSVGIKYYVRDEICDVISCYASSFATEKNYVYTITS